ncbi:secretory phospholipase A2 receptor-like [Ostrea edulis]|uniref:secretory phospholipase A2 receptor-like n=1 Tax=Ostrea edulis TaxID=37623 RepID=UPI0024AF9E92|nr:secretory phospholipase A2 receptor-like [Ostrea edulis]
MLQRVVWDYVGIRYIMFSLIVFCVTFDMITCRTEFIPRTYVYYSMKQTWSDASQTCTQAGATLAHFPDISTIMDILEELPQIKNMTVWNDHTSNRNFQNGQTHLCQAIILSANKTTSYASCLQKLPFMCLYLKGKCWYRVYEQTSIVGNNIFTKTAISWQHCHDLCETATEITCRSFEYNLISQYCQLSDTNRWHKLNQFAFYVKSWNYYHKTCTTALLQSEYLEYLTDSTSRSSVHSTSRSSVHSTSRSSAHSTSTVSTDITSKDSPVNVDGIQPLRIVLFDNPLPWADANTFCQAKGGSLVILNDRSIVPEANLTSSDNSQTIWIGLSQDVGEIWTWVNGDRLTESNWKYKPNRHDTSQNCASATLNSPYWWYESACHESKPFVCQFNEGTCRYQEEMDSVIVAHNKFVLFNSSLTQCYHLCNSSTQITCRSFEYNQENQTCQVSDVNRWMEGHYFLQYISGWNYYHRTCYFGVDDYAFTTTSTTVPVTIYTTEHNTKNNLQPRTSTVEPFEVLQRELKEIGVKIREKKRKASRTSVNDTRPSATSVGVVAIIVIVSMVGGVVLLDISTLHMHCKHFSGRNKKKDSKHRYSQRQELEIPNDNSAYLGEVHVQVDNFESNHCRVKKSINLKNVGVAELHINKEKPEIRKINKENVDVMSENSNNNVKNPYRQDDTQL